MFTQTVYDDLDLPMEVTDALSHKTKFESNGNRDVKKLTDARNNVYLMAWDKSGVRKFLEWPDNDKQTNVYDANGDLSQWKAKVKGVSPLDYRIEEISARKRACQERC